MITVPRRAAPLEGLPRLVRAGAAGARVHSSNNSAPPLRYSGRCIDFIHLCLPEVALSHRKSHGNVGTFRLQSCESIASEH